MFCVFSGQGVIGLRRYLNSEATFADMRDRTPSGYPRHPNAIPVVNGGGIGNGGLALPDIGFDDQEPDVVDDDDGLDDGSEMVIDVQPLPAPQAATPGIGGTSLDAGIIPPPPPIVTHPLNPTVAPWQGPGPGPFAIQPIPAIRFPSQPESTIHGNSPSQLDSEEDDMDEQGDAMDVSPAHVGASTAPLGSHGVAGPSRAETGSGSGSAVSSSTASIARTALAGNSRTFTETYDPNGNGSGSRNTGEGSNGA